MKKRIAKLLGASVLVAGAILPLSACATPYGDDVRTSVTYAHGTPNGYWSNGRYYHYAPRYYAPPRYYYAPRSYSRWYWSQPYWWRKHHQHDRWDYDQHDRDGDRDHDGGWRSNDRDWNRH
jgi:hypothetical protein